MTAADICEAHWVRAKIRKPSFRAGLCKDSFAGKPIRREEEPRLLSPHRRLCAILDCGARLNRGNSSGFCSRHQKKGFVPEERRKKVAAATRRYYQANKEKVAAARRRGK